MKVSKTLWHTTTILVSISLGMFVPSIVFAEGRFETYVAVGGMSLAACMWVLLVNVFEVDREQKELEK